MGIERAPFDKYRRKVAVIRPQLGIKAISQFTPPNGSWCIFGATRQIPPVFPTGELVS